jgi:hypothetical protein
VSGASTTGETPSRGTTRPLVLAGAPRSGTTWTMRVLEEDPSLYPLMEPDNESRSAPAIWGKRRSGRFPVRQPGDRDADLRWLWSWILDGAPESGRLKMSAPVLRAVRPGGRRRFYQGRWSPLMQLAGALGTRPAHPRLPALGQHRLLVKTVHLPLAVEWLASEFDVDVLVLLRHPANVLASWISLDLNDQFARLDEQPAIGRRIHEGAIPPPGTDPLERLVWQIGVLMLGLEEAAAAHPDWVVRTHEELCVEPMVKFRRLYTELGLTWTEGAERYLDNNDRPGEGFPTQRVASDQPDAWKTRLTPPQVESVRRVLSRFPLTTWTAADYEL